jgi:hypothetical protein
MAAKKKKSVPPALLDSPLRGDRKEDIQAERHTGRKTYRQEDIQAERQKVRKD